jgi:hypothetical protein
MDQGHLVGKPEERTNLEDPCVDGRIIFKWILKEVRLEGVDWISLAQDRDK